MQPNFLDLWDASDEISQPRSRLYSLEPLGLGTGLQEALISYLVRLIDALFGLKALFGSQPTESELISPPVRKRNT